LFDFIKKIFSKGTEAGTNPVSSPEPIEPEFLTKPCRSWVDQSLTTRNGNSYRTTVGIVRQNIAKTQSLGLARAVERHSHCPHPSSTGQITARSAGQSSGRLRWSQGHAGGVGVSSHSRPLLNTGRITAGNARRRGISES
jgi:hypothetical protein